MVTVLDHRMKCGPVLDLPGAISGGSCNPLGFEGLAVVSVYECPLEYPDFDQVLGHGSLLDPQPWASIVLEEAAPRQRPGALCSRRGPSVPRAGA